MCGVLWLLSAFILTFLFNWMLTRNDDSQSGLFERVLNSKALKTVVVCFVAVSFVVFIVSTFNPWFWYDESFTLNLIRLNYADGIDITAHDVHPPLYYIMLKAWLSALSFGSNNIYVITVLSRLFSLVAYVLTGLLCLRKFKSGGGNSYAPRLLILCLCAFPSLLQYGVEIRMYSWALLFVTATFLFARDAIRGKSGWGTWVAITLFSVCATYTHYFALISVSIIWLILLPWFFLHDKRMLLKWCVCAVISALAYLPWLLVLLQQVRQVSEGYWITLNTGDFFRYYCFLLIPLHTILPFLFIKALRTEDNGKPSFDDVAGLIVPIATIIAGVALSVVFRPILTQKYLVPSAFCLWISLFLIFRHARGKERFIFVCMLLFAFLVTSGREASKFVSDCKEMQATNRLLDKLDTDATFVFPSGSEKGTVPTVLSCLKKNDIVTLNVTHSPPLGKERDKLMFPNITNYESEEEMWKYLRSCKELYYINTGTSKKAESPVPAGYAIVCIGDCVIEETACQIYKLIPRG